MGLTYAWPANSERPDIIAYAGASLAPLGAHSHTGCILTPNYRGAQHLIAWHSCRQNGVVARSSCEAEIIALATGLDLLGPTQILLEEIGWAKVPTLNGDNSASLSSMQWPKWRTRHLSIKGESVAAEVAQSRLHLRFVSSQAQLADSLTKGVNPSTLSGFKRAFMEFST